MLAFLCIAKIQHDLFGSNFLAEMINVLTHTTYTCCNKNEVIIMYCVFIYKFHAHTQHYQALRLNRRTLTLVLLTFLPDNTHLLVISYWLESILDLYP